MKIVLSFIVISILNNCNTQNIAKKCSQENQHIDPCGICTSKCINGNFVENVKENCTEGCICPRGFIIDDNNNCISIEECKGVPKCQDNAEYISCGPPCSPMCRGGSLLYFKCIACCKPGCFCKDGYVINDDGVCIKRDECEPSKI